MDDLDALMTPRRTEDAAFSWDVPAGWEQGREAFGGLVIGSLVRAIEAFSASPERSVRSVTAELPGPTLAGPAEIRAEALRIGSGQSTIAARLVQADGVKAHAVAVLAKPRATDAQTWNELTPPTLPDWRSMPVMPAGFGPRFAQHIHFRTPGPFPFTSGSEALATGWVSLARAPRSFDAAVLVALADAWWPASFSRMPAPRPIGTVAFTCQIVGSAGTDTWRPLAYRARSWVQSEGWIVEQRELWTDEGRLVALNQQTIAVIA